MITIIGGGIFGLAIGWRLAQAGRRVTLFERGQVGRGATWAAAGMLMPWKISPSFNPDLFRLQQESHRLWPAFAQELAAATNIPLDYQTNGRYFVAVTPQAVRRFRKQYEFHQRLGFPLRWLSGDEARRELPCFGPQVKAAIFSPLGHWVDNRRVVAALKQAFLKAGGKLCDYTTVSEIIIRERQVVGLRLGRERLKTGTVILAAGAWSGQIKGVPEALAALVQPLKGQTLVLQMSPAAPLFRHQLIGPVYLVPRRDGRLIVGTSYDWEAGFDVQPTVGSICTILWQAQKIVPAIKKLPILEMSAGLRPTAADNLPVLGATMIEGLIMATGGHSYGILLSPLVAQALSRLALTGQTSEVIQPFSPNNIS